VPLPLNQNLSPTMDVTEIREFGKSQLEAALWCDQAGRAGSFRTAELNPALGDWPTPAEFETGLQALRVRRRTLLGSVEQKAEPPGRLLVCQIHESISSGESEAETSGFFDVNDRPPWDTWVWQLRGMEEGTVTLVSFSRTPKSHMSFPKIYGADDAPAECFN
jgi:hypothetical protein